MLAAAVIEAPATASVAFSGRAKGSSATESVEVVPWVVAWVFVGVFTEALVMVDITTALGDELVAVTVVWLSCVMGAACAEGSLAADALATGRSAVGISGARSSKSASAKGSRSAAAAGRRSELLLARGTDDAHRRKVSTEDSKRAEDTLRRGIFQRLVTLHTACQTICALPGKRSVPAPCRDSSRASARGGQKVLDGPLGLASGFGSVNVAPPFSFESGTPFASHRAPRYTQS